MNEYKGNFAIKNGMSISYRNTIEEAVKIAKARSKKTNNKIKVMDWEYKINLYECEHGIVKSLIEGE